MPDLVERLNLEYRTADNLRGIGACLMLGGLLVYAALFMTWMELGRWTEVLTWGAILAALLLGIGALVGWVGDKAALRHSDSAKAERARRG